MCFLLKVVLMLYFLCNSEKGCNSGFFFVVMVVQLVRICVSILCILLMLLCNVCLILVMVMIFVDLFVVGLIISVRQVQGRFSLWVSVVLGMLVMLMILLLFCFNWVIFVIVFRCGFWVQVQILWLLCVSFNVCNVLIRCWCNGLLQGWLKLIWVICLILLVKQVCLCFEVQLINWCGMYRCFVFIVVWMLFIVLIVIIVLVFVCFSVQRLVWQFIWCGGKWCG